MGKGIWNFRGIPDITGDRTDMGNYMTDMRDLNQVKDMR